MHKVLNKENDIATVRDDQRSTMDYYSNFLKKAISGDFNIILMDIDGNDDLEQGDDVKMIDAFEEEAIFEV